MTIEEVTFQLRHEGVVGLCEGQGMTALPSSEGRGPSSYPGRPLIELVCDCCEVRPEHGIFKK